MVFVKAFLQGFLGILALLEVLYILTGALCVRNTTLGNISALSLTTGADNTLVGYSAGSAVTTGTGNTFIGASIVGVAGACSCWYRFIQCFRPHRCSKYYQTPLYCDK